MARSICRRTLILAIHTPWPKFTPPLTDLRILESDDGLDRVIQSAETYGMRRGERRAQQRKWRKQRRRSVPSLSAVFRCLGEFHDPSEEERRLLLLRIVPNLEFTLHI